MGEPMAYNFGLRSIPYGLLRRIAADSSRNLAFQVQLIPVTVNQDLQQV